MKEVCLCLVCAGSQVAARVIQRQRKLWACELIPKEVSPNCEYGNRDRSDCREHSRDDFDNLPAHDFAVIVSRRDKKHASVSQELTHTPGRSRETEMLRSRSKRLREF